MLVGDPGLLTEARLREEVQPAGLDRISALRKSGIRKLVAHEHVQLDLFDERNLAELRSELYPSERIMLCRNPSRPRSAKLYCRKPKRPWTATRRTRSPLRSEKAIGLRMGNVIGRWKMRKHFTLVIQEGHFSYARNEASIHTVACMRSGPTWKPWRQKTWCAITSDWRG